MPPTCRSSSVARTPPRRARLRGGGKIRHRVGAGRPFHVKLYAVCLAFFGPRRSRRRLSPRFLFAAAAAGMIALGLVVVNVGTLYRLRYVFLMLLIIPAAAGAAFILDRRSKKPTTAARGR